MLLQAVLAMFSGAESKSRQGRRERAGLESPCATVNAAWRSFTPGERGKHCLEGHNTHILPVRRSHIRVVPRRDSHPEGDQQQHSNGSENDEPHGEGPFLLNIGG